MFMISLRFRRRNAWQSRVAPDPGWALGAGWIGHVPRPDWNVSHAETPQCALPWGGSGASRLRRSKPNGLTGQRAY